LPGSNGRIEAEVLAYLKERFGVPEEANARLIFEERADQIWASSAHPPPGIGALRPSGLRAFRRMPDGLKPTSAFLIALADRIAASRIELPRDRLIPLLHGRTIDLSASDGYVALSYNGDVIGCGRIRAGRLQALIPTGRRRELIEILTADVGGGTEDL